MGWRQLTRWIVVGAIGMFPAGAHASVIRVHTAHAPKSTHSVVARLRVVRAGDGVIVAARNLATFQSISVARGVDIVLGDVSGWHRRALVASSPAVAQGRRIRVTLRLHRVQAGVASAGRAAAGRVAAAASAPVITAQGVVLDGTSGQPDIALDPVLNGYLFDALHGDGVRVVDQTPQFTLAAVKEQVLSEEGRLATPFTFNPLTPTHVVRGSGRIHGGKVDINLRIVDGSGVIIAVASAHGPARELRDVVVSAVNKLAREARGKLDESQTPLQFCRSGGPGCYGVRVTVEGVFDATGGWGSGSVAPPSGHGGSINEGFDAVEHGSFGLWPTGTAFTLIASPHMGSHFDHWSGDCRGSARACTLRAAPNLDVTALFAEDLWTLTVVNKNPSGGELAGERIGCGIREHACSRVIAGQTSPNDVFHLYVYPEASHLVSLLEGCDEFVGDPVDGGDCRIAATANKTITVDFACNPNATTNCSGTPAARDRIRAWSRQVRAATRLSGRPRGRVWGG